MKRMQPMAAGMAVGAMIALVLAMATGAASATTGTLSMDVATFAHHDSATTHDGVCAAPYPGYDAEENRGTMTGDGGYFGSVNLAQGSTMTAFRLTARDFDADYDVYAYLVRKRMKPSAVPGSGFAGYTTLANTQSSGSSQNLRRFTDPSVANALVDNATYAYFVEVVVCVDTLQPIGIQVAWTKP